MDTMTAPARSAQPDPVIPPELLACPAWCGQAKSDDHGWDVDLRTGEAVRCHELGLDEHTDRFAVWIGVDDRLGVAGVQRSQPRVYVSAPDAGRGFTAREAQRFQELLARAARQLDDLEAAQSRG